jgi:hypothetical protein
MIYVGEQPAHRDSAVGIGVGIAWPSLDRLRYIYERIVWPSGRWEGRLKKARNELFVRGVV